MSEQEILDRVGNILIDHIHAMSKENSRVMGEALAKITRANDEHYARVSAVGENMTTSVLTFRQQAAIATMQGILAGGCGKVSVDALASDIVLVADALIKELEK